ncbi:paraquat-inducible protein A [Pacificibacter sp. AS14]|uniref:paraquat-inducible protein A n=1 Tax=Pacificibacter sp. AS14 TaxID=3135785 RepID=UPI00318140A7
MNDVQTLAPEHFLVCPQCDAAYVLARPKTGERATCARCHTVLIRNMREAGIQVIALSLAIAILIVAATFFPFLTINAAGASNSASLLDAALAFSDGPLVALSLTTAALIVVVPFVRVTLAIYVLLPMVLSRAPAHGAMQAFRLSEALRPWSMVEIFALGCAVALIKISDLADVTFGPAFWMFAVLVVLVVIQDNLICRWSIWDSLETPKLS